MYTDLLASSAALEDCSVNYTISCHEYRYIWKVSLNYDMLEPATQYLMNPRAEQSALALLCNYIPLLMMCYASARTL
jgi:hypothetical protein